MNGSKWVLLGLGFMTPFNREEKYHMKNNKKSRTRLTKAERISIYYQTIGAWPAAGYLPRRRFNERQTYHPLICPRPTERRHSMESMYMNISRGVINCQEWH